MLSSAWFVAVKDVAHMLRQKEAVLWIFVMPFLFFYFIGTVTGSFGGAMGGEEDRPDPLLLQVPSEGGFLIDELERRLEAESFAVARTDKDPKSDEEMESYVRRLRLPEPTGEHTTFTDAVLAKEQAVVTFSRSEPGLGAQFDQVRVARAVYGVLADLAVATDAGETPTADSFLKLAEMPRAVTVKVTKAGERKAIPGGYEQTIPGIMVMFTMLVLLTTGSILLVIEREQGLLRRLASTPISRSSVVLGKWMGRMALGLVQIGVALLIGTFVFRMAWGAAFPMICLLLFGWAAFNASFGILLANLSRTQAQMAGIGVSTTMVLAALGGCWWPIEITPAWMQKLALFLPSGWAMDSMHQLVSFGHPASSAMPHLVAMLVAATVVGWLAVRTFRYQ